MVSVGRGGTTMVSVAGGGSVAEAGGASDSVSFTNDNGVTGMMGAGLDQRPRYGHRGSGVGV